MTTKPYPGLPLGPMVVTRNVGAGRVLYLAGDLASTAAPGNIANADVLVVLRCREVNPNMALACETYWDRAFQYAEVAYVRMNWIDMETPALYYTFPEWTSTTCAESPGAFNVLNNGMRYGLVWAVQPRHYNDSMDQPLTRPLSGYVRELIRIRTKHKELLFHGRFRDTLGAHVEAGKNVRH